MTNINRFNLACLTVVALILVFPTIGLAGENSPSMKITKSGTVTLGVAQMVGDVTLQPGVYTVKHRAGDSGDHYLYFKSSDKSHETKVPVVCEMEPAGKTIQRTRTDTVSENGVSRISKIKVQGNNAAFVL